MRLVGRDVERRGERPGERGRHEHDAEPEQRPRAQHRPSRWPRRSGWRATSRVSQVFMPKPEQDVQVADDDADPGVGPASAGPSTRRKTIWRKRGRVALFPSAVAIGKAEFWRRAARGYRSPPVGAAGAAARAAGRERQNEPQPAPSARRGGDQRPDQPLPGGLEGHRRADLAAFAAVAAGDAPTGSSSGAGVGDSPHPRPSPAGRGSSMAPSGRFLAPRRGRRLG